MAPSPADFQLTATEAATIFWRNAALLLLSLLVGGRTLYLIGLAQFGRGRGGGGATASGGGGGGGSVTWSGGGTVGGRHHPHPPTVRSFANTLMGVLLLVEMVSSVSWLVGVAIAGGADGSAPWTIDLPTAERLCVPVAAITVFCNPAIFMWHVVMSWSIYAWVVKQQPLSVLTRRLKQALVVVALLSLAFVLIPFLEDNLGLWPHSNCFVKRAWNADGSPTPSVIVDRMVLLPICWLLVVALNLGTVQHLQREDRRRRRAGRGRESILGSSGGGGSATKRLQVRLILVTLVFALVWFLQSLPLFLRMRSFGIDMGFKWLFAIGFLDALIYGGADAVNCLGGCIPSFLCRCVRPSTARGGAQRPDVSLWETVDEEAGMAAATGGQGVGLVSVGPAARPRAHQHQPNQRPRGRLGLPSWASPAAAATATAAAAAAPYRPASYTPYHIFATTLDLNHEPLPFSSSSSSSSSASTSAPPPHHAPDIALAQGLAAWIPRPAETPEPYHLYVVAVQRCRALTRLRQAIQEHLGGPARYVLAGSAEIGDSLYGKTALLVFARASDVESGAFRLLGANQRPVVLGAVRGGCKGLAGLAFRYYDTAAAVITAHLPGYAAAAAAGPASSLRERDRDRHVAAMLRALRIGGQEHEAWDAHLQFHHVILLGGLNYRLRLPPDEVLRRVAASAAECQAHVAGGVGGGGGKAAPLALLSAEAAASPGGWRGLLYRRLWAGAESAAYEHGLDDTHLESLQERPGEEDDDEDDEDDAATAAESSTVGGGVSSVAVVMDGGTQGPGVGPVDTKAWLGKLFQAAAKSWAWVECADVLAQRMARGLLLHGFHEHAITFPPTFKRRVRSPPPPGDYADVAALEAAYLTRRGQDNAELVPPSYTDRILVRSLPDAAPRAVLSAYDSCDTGAIANASDHRGVSLALTLLVDATQLLLVDPFFKRHRPPTPVSSPGGGYSDDEGGGGSEDEEEGRLDDDEEAGYDNDDDTAQAMAAASSAAQQRWLAWQTRKGRGQHQHPRGGRRRRQRRHHHKSQQNTNSPPPPALARAVSSSSSSSSSSSYTALSASPILVSLALSNFVFRLNRRSPSCAEDGESSGGEEEEGDAAAMAAAPTGPFLLKEQSSLATASSGGGGGESGGGVDGAAAAVGGGGNGEEGEQPQPQPPASGPPTASAESHDSDDFAAVGLGGAEGSEGDEVEIAECCILYPLPCEDALLSLRRHHAMDASLRASLSNTDPPQPQHQQHRRRSSSSASAANPTEGGGEEGLAGSPPPGANPTDAVPPDEGAGPGRPRGFSSSSRDSLPNLHTLLWHPNLLYAAQSAKAAATRRRARPRLPLGIGGGGGASSSSDGRSQSHSNSNSNNSSSSASLASSAESGALHVDVLTLGPPPPLQHALIKFVGPRGEEVGQGVISVGSAFATAAAASAGGGGLTSLSSFLRQRLGVAPRPPTRQTVDLSLGGRLLGTVSFDLGIKARKRARDGSRLRVPSQHG